MPTEGMSANGFVVQQIRVGKLAVFSYLVGDVQSKTCALIDPAFETDRILHQANAAGYRVNHVINTHGHSDHTAGNAEIIRQTGASLLIHAADAGRLSKTLHKVFSRVLGGKGSPQADRLLEHNGTIQIGATALTVIHTPGHTPGSVCLYASGHVFTGDTLFVGAVGRTDLPGGSYRRLIHSIRETICPLPGETIVWPGHDYGATPHSTVRWERKTNPFLQ